MGMLNGASPLGVTRGKSDAAGVRADQDLKHRLATTAVLLAFAVVAIAMATFAWFSIADSAKTRMLAMDATADGSLRFGLTCTMISKTMCIAAGAMPSRLAYRLTWALTLTRRSWNR